MKGIPSKIQTPQDLRNLHELWQDPTWQAQNGKIDTELFIERIDFLCDQQFFHVPIINVDGADVTTRFFHEVAEGSETNNGLTVAAVEHFTPPEDLQDEDDGEENTVHTCTMITLSAALPEGEKFLHIKNSCNCLNYNGFDMEEVQAIRTALQNSLPKEVA